MSFSGYKQILCKNGHLDIVDIYETIDWDDEGPTSRKWNCPYCGAEEAWDNLVDTTNGSYDTHPLTGKKVRIDGYVKLKIKTPAKKCQCLSCKNIHIKEPETYYIPIKKKK